MTTVLEFLIDRIASLGNVFGNLADFFTNVGELAQGSSEDISSVELPDVEVPDVEVPVDDVDADPAE